MEHLKFKQMNKRGDISSIFIIIISLLIIGVVVVAAGYVTKEVNAALKDVEEINSSANAVAAINVVDDNAINWFDLAFFMLLVGLSLGLLVSSIYVNVSPTMTMVFFILLIIAVIFAGIVSNVWAEVTSTDELALTTEQFKLTKTIMPIMPLIILGLGVLTIAILYGKPRAGV